MKIQSGIRPPAMFAGAKLAALTMPSDSGESVTLSANGRSGWHQSIDLVRGLEVDGAPVVSLAQALVAAQSADGGWKESAGAQLSDRDSSVLNHVALTTLLRRALHAREYPNRYTLENRARLLPDEAQTRSLEQALSKSWNHLAPGKKVQGEALLGPLPSKVLKGLSQAPAQLHEALLGDSLEVRLEPKACLEKALQLAEDGSRGGALPAQPAKSLAPKILAAAGVAAVGVGTALALQAGILSGAALLLAGGAAAQVLAGMATGWMVASVDESVIHDKVAHVKDLPGTSVPKENPSLVSRVASLGPKWLSDKLYNSWFGHTKIHHYRTFVKDYVSQFRNEDDQKKVDQYLIKNGREDLIDEEYGATLSWKGYLMFQAVASPSYALALGAANMLGAGPLFALGFAVPTAAYPFFSKEYHRYTHKPAKEALASASPLMGAFLKTPMSRFITRHHFMHHVDDNTNFNLMPGADFLRGKAVKATVAHQEELRRLGVLY